MSAESLLAVGSALFAIVAGWFLYVGLSMNVVVATDAGEVANLQLMHIQASNTSIGIGAAIVSAVLATGSAIVTALRKSYEEPE